MKEKFISLLYPNEESQIFHSDRNNLPRITEEVCDELGLSGILELKNSSLTDYFTADTEVIKYRQRAIADMLANEEIKETLSKIYPILDDIVELRRLDSDSSNPGDS